MCAVQVIPWEAKVGAVSVALEEQTFRKKLLVRVDIVSKLDRLLQASAQIFVEGDGPLATLTKLSQEDELSVDQLLCECEGLLLGFHINDYL